jgi:hypothetical protein
MGSSVGGLVGGIAGSFFGAPQVGAALGSAAGGLLGGSKQSGAAAGAQGAAGSSIYGAGQYGQQAAQFRPIGVTTGFGSSNFDYDEFGRLKSAGYTLTPELQGIRDRAIQAGVGYNPELIGQMAQPLGAASQGLFGLGGRYIAESPEQAAAQAMEQRQALLAPGRAAEDARLATANYGRGTGGLGVQTGTGTAPSNPLAQALFNARAKQDDELAAQSDLLGQQRALFGADLYTRGAGLLGQVPTLTSAGYNPLRAQLGTASTIEGMGQQAMDISTALGAQQSTAGARAGGLGLSGAVNAAPYQITQQSYSPLGQILGGSSGQLGQVGGQIGNWFGDLIGGGSGMGLLNASPTSQSYMNAIGATSSGPYISSNQFANESWM